MLGLRPWRPQEIDVIAPVEAGRKITGIRRRFVPTPVGGEVWRRHGVPLTSPARTIVDCAGISDAGGVGELIEQAAVEGLLDVVSIDRVLDGPRRRGTKKLLRALAPWRRYRRGIKIRSRMEAKWWKPTVGDSTTTRQPVAGTANATTPSRRPATTYRGSAGRTCATVPAR
jgi:hypothetical protein